jgi:hypothetical protein
VAGIPAESTIELKFGATRRLCCGASGIGPGSSMPLKLNFEKFGAVKVTVEIREPPQG